jgi:hypothetical protein
MACPPTQVRPRLRVSPDPDACALECPRGAGPREVTYGGGTIAHEEHSSRTRWPAAIEFIAVGLLLLVVGLHSYVREDIWFWDDATYMARGILPEVYGEPSWVDSPLYSGMYAVLGTFQSDTIALYFVGRALSAVLFVALVWLSARLVSARSVAWAVAAVAAMLPVTYIWPGVSAPASGLLVLAVVVIYRRPSPVTLAAAAGLTWLAAASRPEFTWIAVALSVAAMASCVLAQMRGPKSASPLKSGAGVALLALVPPLVLAVRYPTMFERSSREWTAFSQHFALRNPQDGLDSWQSAGAIAAQTFPGADTILGAALVNPSALLEHVLRNTVQLPLSLAGHALAIEPGSVLQPTLAKAAAASLVIGLLLAAVINRRSLVPMLRSAWTRSIHMPLLAASATLIVILVGSLLAMLVIYPRPHYLLLPIGLLLVASAAWLSRVPDRRFERYLPVAAVAVLFTALVVAGIPALSSRVSSPPPYESSLRELKALGASGGLVSGDTPIEVFLPGTVRADLGADQFASIADALDSRDVHVLQVSPLLTTSPWAQLGGFDEFYANPGTLGFRQVVPGSSLWVR